MTNANKVKVSKEVAKAIEELISRNGGNHGDALGGYLQTRKFTTEKLIPLNTMYQHVAVQAIYFGYEVEETPAEKVAKHYRNLSELYEKFGYDSDLAAMRGIEFVAEAFGLKIEGVNVK